MIFMTFFAKDNLLGLERKRTIISKVNQTMQQVSMIKNGWRKYAAKLAFAAASTSDIDVVLPAACVNVGTVLAIVSPQVETPCALSVDLRASLNSGIVSIQKITIDIRITDTDMTATTLAILEDSGYSNRSHIFF